jgi:hypothetical protein
MTGIVWEDEVMNRRLKAYVGTEKKGIGMAYDGRIDSVPDSDDSDSDSDLDCSYESLGGGLGLRVLALFFKRLQSLQNRIFQLPIISPRTVQKKTRRADSQPGLEHRPQSNATPTR